MLLRHRRRHLVLWLVLGPLILLGFAFGLAARREFPAPRSTDAPGSEAAEVRP